MLKAMKIDETCAAMVDLSMIETETVIERVIEIVIETEIEIVIEIEVETGTGIRAGCVELNVLVIVKIATTGMSVKQTVGEISAQDEHIIGDQAFIRDLELTSSFAANMISLRNI